MSNESKSARLMRFARNNQVGMALILSIGLFIVNVIVNPRSFNINAFGSIFGLTTMLAFAAAGQTLVMISGGIDMSVGVTMSMTGLMTVVIMQARDGYLLITFLVALGVSTLIGLANGIGVVKIGLPPMIITLSVANVVSRLQYVFTQGKPNGSASVAFTKVMIYRLFDVLPAVTMFGLLFFAAVLIILNRTRFGQQLFLTGNNERAAYLTGIKTNQIKILTYVIAAVFSGIAGWIGAGYMTYVLCQTFDSYTMMSIVAVVIGGTLLVGGKGSYLGSIAGALLMVVLSNFLSVLDLPQSIRDIIMGIVLILLLTVYNRARAIRQ